MRYTAETGASRSTADGKTSSPPSAAAHMERKRLVNFDIIVALQKAEVSHKIKPNRTESEACEANHLGQVAPAVAPVERDYRDVVPRAGGVAVALVGRQLVEWNGAD